MSVRRPRSTNRESGDERETKRPRGAENEGSAAPEPRLIVRNMAFFNTKRDNFLPYLEPRAVWPDVVIVTGSGPDGLDEKAAAAAEVRGLDDGDNEGVSEEWKLHRIILGTRSKFFHRLFLEERFLVTRAGVLPLYDLSIPAEELGLEQPNWPFVWQILYSSGVEPVQIPEDWLTIKPVKLFSLAFALVYLEAKDLNLAELIPNTIINEFWDRFLDTKVCPRNLESRAILASKPPAYWRDTKRQIEAHLNWQEKAKFLHARALVSKILETCTETAPIAYWNYYAPYPKSPQPGVDYWPENLWYVEPEEGKEEKAPRPSNVELSDLFSEQMWNSHSSRQFVTRTLYPVAALEDIQTEQVLNHLSDLQTYANQMRDMWVEKDRKEMDPELLKLVEDDEPGPRLRRVYPDLFSRPLDSPGYAPTTPVPFVDDDDAVDAF